MDDIWASYYIESLNYKVVYNKPTVYQDRNDHDLSIDLEKEMVGYKNTLTFLQRLNDIEVTGSTVIEMYSSIIEGIKDLSFISEEMSSFQRAWLEDIEKIL